MHCRTCAQACTASNSSRINACARAASCCSCSTLVAAPEGLLTQATVLGSANITRFDQAERHCNGMPQQLQGQRRSSTPLQLPLLWPAEQHLALLPRLPRPATLLSRRQPPEAAAARCTGAAVVVCEESRRRCSKAVQAPLQAAQAQAVRRRSPGRRPPASCACVAAACGPLSAAGASTRAGRCFRGRGRLGACRRCHARCAPAAAAAASSQVRALYSAHLVRAACHSASWRACQICPLPGSRCRTS